MASVDEPIGAQPIAVTWLMTWLRQVLFAALIVLVVTTFRDYAISNDEEVQQHYGALIVAYYASGFTDQTLFHFRDLYLYGGLFDVIAVGLQKLVPLDPYDVRHLLCAFIGLGGIGSVWATARMIGGSRAGLLAAAALVGCAESGTAPCSPIRRTFPSLRR